MNCPQCHTDNPDDSKFCQKCGTDFSITLPMDSELTQTIGTVPQELIPGKTFAGRYKIESELGRGGMGIVYKAQDLKLKRRVALKLLPLGFLHIPEIRDRFLLEAQAAAVLDHPNICTVYESDEADGRPFISMAYIQGQSLKEIVGKGAQSVKNSLDITIQIASGLEEAHKQGVIHRDIKSGNILVTPKNQAKILDFGIARITGTASLTQEGTTMGTVAYMSPEQARGERVDHRSDLWSLGIILYEMLSSRLPFRGDSMQSMVYSILNDPPAPLGDIGSDQIPEIEKVLNKALAKQVEARYGSAHEFIQDLEKLRSGIPVSIPAPEKPVQLNSVAVIDFANITKDPTCDWLSIGIAETVSVDLKKIATLKVVSREQVQKAIADQAAAPAVTEKEILKIGEFLKVRWLVWGGFQKMGEAIRITAHFTETESGNLIGSAKVDGIMQDIFNLQDLIIHELMQALDLEISDSELDKIQVPETIELEAYEYYARGRQLIYQMGKKGFPQAQAYLEKAIAIDSDYALAYSGLGSLHTLKFISASDPKDLELGISHLQEAIKHDPDLTDPYLWLTYGYGREKLYEKAIQVGQKAVEMEADNPLAHYFLAVAFTLQAAMTYRIEQYPQAIKHYLINIRLHPYYEPARINIAWIYLLHGSYSEAFKHLQQAVKIEESGKPGIVRFVGALTLMGNLFLRKKEFTKAVDWFQRSLKLLDQTDHVYKGAFTALTFCGMGQIDLWQGEYAQALKNFKKAIEAIQANQDALGIGYFQLMVHVGMATAFYALNMKKEETLQYQNALELIAHKQSYDFSWIWEGSDAQSYYHVASYHAFANRKKETYLYLNKASKCGWADLPLLETNENFATFRNDKEFVQIKKSIKNRMKLSE